MPVVPGVPIAHVSTTRLINASLARIPADIEQRMDIGFDERRASMAASSFRSVNGLAIVAARPACSADRRPVWD